MVHGQLVEPVAESDKGPRDSAGPGEAPTAAGKVGIAVEPDRDMVREIARQLLSAERETPDPAAFDTLMQKARLLEQISTPEEVSRMSQRIRDALGVPTFPVVKEGAGSGSIDFDQAQLVSSERLETPDAIEIREHLIDASGAWAEIAYVRRQSPGGIVYEQVFSEAGREPILFESSAEEFDAAVARQRPFAIINRFPLLQSLHREAVLPLMDKLARDASPTTQPAPPEKRVNEETR